jgi:hypothetical protein
LGYALEIATYLLNLVSSKSVPKTPVELWFRRKSIMRYIHIWGCPTHVLKGKSDKLEPKTKRIYFFVGYPKGTKGRLFYSPENRNVFVIINDGFLEDE